MVWRAKTLLRPQQEFGTPFRYTVVEVYFGT